MADDIVDNRNGIDLQQMYLKIKLKKSENLELYEICKVNRLIC